ncbi:hypothetical protein BB934_40475 (plasmid) [Microvirga ossetica]|uniref:Uncharacterized protein n=1 Tax=Microvirga ossetica TaxID=1882682 RepID=A0A1B2EWZ9_9HYPH|nr:hypothetical protein BB934_40475 [Microvirga ossetica]
MTCLSSTEQVPGHRSAEPPRRAGFPSETSRPPVADNKPANYKLIDLHAPDPRPSDHQPPNSESADRDGSQGHSAERQSPDRGGTYSGHSNGGISQSG